MTLLLLLLKIKVIHPPSSSFQASAKIRYRQSAQACTVTLNPDTTEAEVVFHDQQRAITPGQAIVFYQNNNCLGGGTISHL